MTATHLIERKRCPLCGEPDRKSLFAVPPQVFVGNNPTIDQGRLRDSGLLELPPIEIVECPACQLRYCGQMLSPRWNRIFWEQVYIPDQSQTKIMKATKRLGNIRIWSALCGILLEAYVQDGQTLNVLDFGCGWGDFLMTAQAPGVRAVGIEISPPKVAFGRSRGLEIYNRIEDLPPDLKFHALHCDQVFEHLPDPVEALAQLEPRLHQQFAGYVGVPDYAQHRVEQLTAAIAAGQQVHDKDLITWDHLNYFSTASFKTFLGTCDFVPVEIPGGSVETTLTSTAAFIRRTSVASSEISSEGLTACLQPSRSARSRWLRLCGLGLASN